MKYAIFHVITGRPKLRLEKFKKEIEREFQLPVVRFKTFPHVTLKYDFETNDIKPIEEVLDNFCSEHRSTEIKISGIGTFDRKVLFLKVKETPQLTKIYEDLYQRLKTVKGFTWESYEGENYKPHLTLVYKQLGENNFGQVLRYVQKKNISLSVSFDNLAVTKLENKERKIHKLYKLA